MNPALENQTDGFLALLINPEVSRVSNTQMLAPLKQRILNQGQYGNPDAFTIVVQETEHLNKDNQDVSKMLFEWYMPSSGSSLSENDQIESSIQLHFY